MSDYYDENGVHSPEGYGQSPRKRDIAFPALVGSLVLAAALLGGYLFFIREEGGAPAATAGPPAVASPSPSSHNPLESRQLRGLADAIALHLDRGNTEVAYSIIIQAETLTGCDITAFTGGAGGADLGVKANRDVVIEDAEAKGIPIAFGHKKDTWIVVAQACTEGGA